MAPPLLEERPQEGLAVASPAPARIYGIDTLRGICVVLMAVFHFSYDLYFYCGFPPGVIANPFMTFAQVASSGGFILLSGFSSRLSRSNLKRGARVLVCGALVCAVTWLWGDFIRFGILQFLGCAMVLYGLTHRFWENLPRWPSLFFYIILFMLTRRLIPVVLDIPYLYPFGIVSPDFRSSDYFPLFPWFFLFLLGSWLAQFRDLLPQSFRELRVPVLSWLGRHSLAVYLIHQPVLVVISMALAFLTGHSFSVG